MTGFRLHFSSMLKFMPVAILGAMLLLFLPSASADNAEMLDNMVLIPGGTFKRGCNRFGPQHGAPEQKVHLDSYWIDKYEVTNKSFEEIFDFLHILKN